MHARRLAASLSLALLLPPVCAAALPGDIYVSEKSTGSVANIRAGGDQTSLPRFATGLSAPTGICVTSEGKVLVAESGSGQVTDITAGGDFTGAGAFASGLDTPMDLFCDADRILVVERSASGQGEITDITAGGSFAGAPSFAAGIGVGAAGLAFETVHERVYASDAGTGRIFDVTNGGVFLSATPFATNGSATAGLAARGEQLLAANPGSGQIVDFTGGGDLAALPVFATLPGVVSVLNVKDDVLLAAAATSGAVYDVTAGGDVGGAQPFASGLALDSEFVGMAHVGGCGDGILDGGEACDDGNVQDGDGCNSSCRVRLCRMPPATFCFDAEHASLSVHEKERKRFVAAGFSASLRGFDGATTLADFGNPLFDVTRYDVCVYDAADDLVGQMIVPRGFDVCGKKQKGCWQPIRDTGYKFSDPELDSAGIGSIVAQSGDAGKGSVQVKGHRNKSHDHLPRMTGNLSGTGKATLQIMVSDGSCFSAELTDVKHADDNRFQAGK